MTSVALSLILGLLPARAAQAPAAEVQAASKPVPKRPAWTYAKAHFETRAGKRVAVAVGHGKNKNLALARAQAEDDGRAALLRLLQGKPENTDAEGLVKGAKPVTFFKARGGVVYARLELAVLSP